MEDVNFVGYRNPYPPRQREGNFFSRNCQHKGFNYVNPKEVMKPQGETLHESEALSNDFMKRMMREFMYKLRRMSSGQNKKISALEEEMKTMEANTQASTKNLEIQISQLATSMRQLQKCNFILSDADINPRESCQAITLRSGRNVVTQPNE